MTTPDLTDEEAICQNVGSPEGIDMTDNPVQRAQQRE